MMRIGGNGCPLWLAFGLAAAGLAQAQTATETVIFNFAEFPQGANPYGTLFRNAGGTLYGTAFDGGVFNLGAVFELAASGYKVVYSFKGSADGANPYAGVVQDSAANLYGTTYLGGPANAGVVYKVSPSGEETVLYAFTGGADGGNPYAGVILDTAGNVYGTTLKGGSGNCSGGCGVVYKITPAGQQNVLYSFTGASDGASPYGGVIADEAGNLYGTTSAGGDSITPEGVVYKVSTAGRETGLHTFGKTNHPGSGPTSGLVRDAAGNLYGNGPTFVYEITVSGQYKALAYLNDCLTIGAGDAWSGVAVDGAGSVYGTTGVAPSSCGGVGDAPYGVVYKVEPSGTVKVLYRFPGASRPNNTSTAPIVASNPGVVLDSAGNIYGATPYGGVSGMVYLIGASGGEKVLHNFVGALGGSGPAAVSLSSGGGFYGATEAGGAANAGTVYEIDSKGRETMLYSFTGGDDGGFPVGKVVKDSAGNLYGVTAQGGAANEGVVYKISAGGQYSVLHSFTGGADGGSPNGVVMDAGGNLYGTTFGGGAGSLTGVQEGVIFKLDPAGNETVLYSFTGLSDGGAPEAVATLDMAGNLYGTTTSGGSGAGVVFTLGASGRYSVLHTFAGPGADGGDPTAGVVLDSTGNIYGAAAGWGVTSEGAPGEGLVFELTPSGAYTVLYTFTGGADGGLPTTTLARDSAGNLYGTTSIGGEPGAPGCDNLGCGVVFQVNAAGGETVLHAFMNGTDGGGGGRLLLGPAGGLFGSSGVGGVEAGGLLYRIAPAAGMATSR